MVWSTLLLSQASAPAGIVDRVISGVGDFILGGIAVFAIGIAYWAIKQWRDSRDAHTEDIKDAGKQHIEMHKAYQASNSQTVAAIDRLSETQKAQTTAIEAQTRELTTVRVSADGNKNETAALRAEITALGRRVDDVIREAVMRRRSHDRMPAVRGEEQK